jgi:hypothetical protein
MADIFKSVAKPEVHATGLIDLGGMLLVKRIVDRAAVPVVGNNNLMSGIIKLGIGGIGHHMTTNRALHVVTGGIVLDGMDDLVGVVAGKIWGGGGQGQTAAVNPGA